MRAAVPDMPTGPTGPTPSLPSSRGVFIREVVIGLTAFPTVVDLFATQAILPTLVRHYQVSPAGISLLAAGLLAIRLRVAAVRQSLAAA